MLNSARPFRLVLGLSSIVALSGCAVPAHADATGVTASGTSTNSSLVRAAPDHMPLGDGAAIAVCGHALKAVGGSTGVLAGYSTTVGQFVRWRVATADPQMGPGTSIGEPITGSPEQLSDTSPVTVCYLHGKYTISRWQADSAKPLPDTVRVVIGLNGNVRADEFGPAAQLRPQDPAVIPGASPNA